MRQPDARDGARMLALVLLAYVASWLLALSGAGAAGSIALQLSFFAVPLGYAAWAGLGAWKANGYARVPLRKLAMVLVASLGSLWLMNGVVQIQLRVIRSTGYAPQAQKEEDQIRVGIREIQKKGLIPSLALLAVVPPFCEETCFRGLLLRGLAARFGPGFALGVTSLLFSLMHSKLIQALPMALLGAYFCSLVYLTGSLWSSILAHAVNNAAVVVFTWVFGTEVPDVVGPWWMYPLSAAVMGLALAWLALDRDPAKGGSPPDP